MLINNTGIQILLLFSVYMIIYQLTLVCTRIAFLFDKLGENA
jgi:hypothetical protein